MMRAGMEHRPPQVRSFSRNPRWVGFTWNGPQGSCGGKPVGRAPGSGVPSPHPHAQGSKWKRLCNNGSRLETHILANGMLPGGPALCKTPHAPWGLHSTGSAARQRSALGSPAFISAGQFLYFTILSSTRRLMARPSSVLLSALGLVFP